MDGDWDEVQRLLLPPPGPQMNPTPATCMAFDTSQELLWVGNQYGRVSSFVDPELRRYTSFKAHVQDPVKALLIHDRGVIALSPTSVHMASRKGPPLWHIIDADMTELTCMSYTSKGTTEILVAGMGGYMFTIDVVKGEITKKIPVTEKYMILRRSRYICAATTHGTIDLLDTITFNIVKTWNAHAALVGDMDAQQDFLVTCGYSLRQGTNFAPDSFVNVYDLKNLVSLSPIPFPPLAAFVRMHPRMLTTSIVASFTGQMHVIDLMNVNTSNNIKHANVTNYLTMLEIAPSGEAMALASGDSHVLLWGSPSKIHFSDLSNPIEYADREEVTAHIDWSPDTPLSTIGMPHYREQLLSAWPSHLISDVGAPPPRVDAHLQRNLVHTDWYGYYTYPPNSKVPTRNQVQNTRTADDSLAGLQAPKFLHEKARDAPHSDVAQLSGIHDQMSAMELSINLKANVPPMYRKVEIKYSKYGLEDFDFGYFNKTKYSGLEIDIPNTYANSLLQVLNYIPLIRNIALQHTATSCVDPLCFLCEMGFLFDMFDKDEQHHVSPINLLKTLARHPQTGPLGLVEEEQPQTPLTHMIQGLNRFICDTIVKNYRNVPPYTSALEQILTTSAITSINCTNCHSEHKNPGDVFVNELVYPVPKSTTRNARAPKATFSQILKSSIERETVGRAWCSRCQRYQNLATRKSIHGVPSVMLLNAAIKSPEAKQLWDIPGWLPDEIGVIVEKGQFFCFEGEDLKLHLERGTHAITVYSLIGLVCDVNSGQNQKSHLVSLINVAHSEPTPQTTSKWHLFNDFLVRPVSKDEALTCHTLWKTPSILAYQIKAANNHIDNSWKQNLDTSILYVDENHNPGPKTYHTLVKNKEIPGPGTVVAIDAEFISIRAPEIEVNSDGDFATILPIGYALGRVSLVRGDSAAFLPELEPETPFIDDYILPSEPIVDYLTSYSGIVATDLNPRTSPHSLITLKQSYKKLWVLLNLGVIFLGHGLVTDFRVINIKVPDSQIIDTAYEFYLPDRKRKLSLAFLAHVVLKEDIQQDNHDSIEDARTALKLHRKYLEWQDAGILKTMLFDIYARGRDTGFRPPQKAGESVASGIISAPATPAKKAIALGLGMTPGSEGWTPERKDGGGGTPMR